MIPSAKVGNGRSVSGAAGDEREVVNWADDVDDDFGAAPPLRTRRCSKRIWNSMQRLPNTPTSSPQQPLTSLAGFFGTLKVFGIHSPQLNLEGGVVMKAQSKSKASLEEAHKTRRTGAAARDRRLDGYPREIRGWAAEP